MPEQTPGFDLYAELEVSPSASVETIDAAWRSLVKRHHPDALSGGTDELDERIRRLNIAHDWLTDPDRRARYDAERTLAPAARAGHTSSPVAGPPAEGAGVDWDELRREVHRRRPRASPATRGSLFASPLFLVAFVLLVVVLGVGSVVALVRLPSAERAPAADALPGAVATPPMTELPSPTPAVDAARLAATLPDVVGGIRLTGESGVGVDLFGADAGGIEELVTRAGGSLEEVAAAYKGGGSDDGEFVTIIGIAVASVSGDALREEFRAMTDEDPDAAVDWSPTTIGSRAVEVSRDADAPEVAAYLVASETAMYLVITSNASLAEEAVSELP